MPEKKNVLFAVEWYDSEINAGVAAYAREAGWILYDFRMYSDVEWGVVQYPQAWFGDGIIALVNHGESSVGRLARDARVPIVDMVNEVPEIQIPRVLADNEAIGAMGAEYYLDIGYEHLAYLRLSKGHVVDARMKGFRDTVIQSGKQYHEVDFLSAPRSLDLAHDLIPWLAHRLLELPKPIGLMMHHDGDNMVTFLACEMAGLSIPDQIAILGVDNNELRCELGPVELTSIDRNLRRHGYEAALLLDRLMHGEPVPAGPILVPPKEVVVRASTDALAFQDADMLRAVSFLRNNYLNPELSVEEVINASGMSRRKLYYLFKKHIGRGIHEELTHLRFEEARHLLATTDLKIFAIAMRAGFTNERQLTQVCKVELGMSPRSYRDQCRATKTKA